MTNPHELKLRVALFLSKFTPDIIGNHTQPTSFIANKDIKSFADYIRELPDKPLGKGE